MKSLLIKRLSNSKEVKELLTLSNEKLAEQLRHNVASVFFQTNFNVDDGKLNVESTYKGFTTKLAFDASVNTEKALLVASIISQNKYDDDQYFRREVTTI